MQPLRFDPFKNRLARDIRNTLSSSFLKAIALKDGSIFKSCGAEYLMQDLAPVFESYVASRLGKYEEAFAIIHQGEAGGALQQAAILWQLQLFFEMHELLEVIWKKAAGRRRKALQALIRAAGMKIHAENNNMKAAVSMALKARAGLLLYGDELGGFAILDSVLAELNKTLTVYGSDTKNT